MLLTGLAGTVKDTVADILVAKHGYIKMSLADPIKRIAQDVYDFTDEQLWGSSENRNKPDTRYERAHYMRRSKCTCCGSADINTRCYLTPRYALQLLGTEWGRHCYLDTWTDVAISKARESGGAGPKVVFADGRFLNEFAAFSCAGYPIVRIKRTGFETAKWDHPSETEQLSADDGEFDHCLYNDGSLAELPDKVSGMLKAIKSE